MQTEVTDLIEEWAAPRPFGPVADSAVEHQVDLVVAADGWSSVMRELAGTERENEIIELESHCPDVPPGRARRRLS
jgi:2-polyprenyl-6-methoxyphenol hydroxylase-like FAD-dependent oxidoreductase